MRRTGKGYVRVVEFVFFNEKRIRDAVYAARNDNPREIVAGSGGGIGRPTESAAIRNVMPLKRINIDDGVLEWPEEWLKVVDATYKWCDNDSLIVAKDRYGGVDYRVTCAKLNVSNTTRRRILQNVKNYACMCAAQFGLIKVC